MVACEDFVEINAPTHKIISESVFANDETAIAAITGIYNELARTDFSDGYLFSVTVLAGMSPDIFETTSVTETRYRPFQQNEISPIGTDDATANLNLWSSAYNIIYMANSILEGVSNSIVLTPKTKNIIEGQALFIRAFSYFYLTNLYGDVPLITITDYRKNTISPRDPSADVWNQITMDLDTAIQLLKGEDEFKDSERTNINRFVAIALQARVYLYRQNWIKAEELSSQVINQISLFELLENPEQVFLLNSREAIWQVSPLGRGTTSTYTWEGYVFRGNNSSPFKLTEDFVEAFEPSDSRLQWIGFNSINNFYFPQKYKDSDSRGAVNEYSMVLRLAEQYLIRAEARAMLGNLSGAINDLDKLRSRAGLDLLGDTDPDITQHALVDMIIEERKRELFSEWGHRWFDLKRTGKASEVLAPIKPLWQDTDVWYPIPGEERAKNPNLGQNNGY